MTLGLAAMALLLSPAAGFWLYLVPLVLLGGRFNIANIPRTSAVLATAPLGAAEIERSVEVLTAWLRPNAGDVAAQFGITVRQLEGVITNQQSAYTTGVAQVLLIGAAVVAVGAVLAWFTFQKRADVHS